MPVTALRASDPQRMGPHRLVGRLGQGGAGTVFLGVSPDDRAVAVKVLREEIVDPLARRRFRHELDSLRRVRGRHLVEVLDADVDADPPYLVTRFVPGQRLDEVIARTGPLDAPALTVLARGLASALATLHAAGVVHRDLTPGNVLLVDGEPQVIDLGLAVVADSTPLTRSGLIAGTLGYVSPEQVLGLEVTPAVDVHAWGATVALAGTGRPPYGTGRPEAVLYRIAHGQPDLAGLPEDLGALVTAAMHRDPKHRPDAVHLLAQLGGATTSPATTVMARSLSADDTGTQPIPVPVPPLAGSTRVMDTPAVAALLPADPVRLPVDPVRPGPHHDPSWPEIAYDGAGPSRQIPAFDGAPVRSTWRPPAPSPARPYEATPCGPDPYEPDPYEPDPYDHARHDQLPYELPRHQPASYHPTRQDPTPHHQTRHDPGLHNPAYDDPAYDDPAYDDPAYDDPAYDDPPLPQTGRLSAVGLAALAALAAAALVAPLVTAATVLLLLVLLRTITRSREHLHYRRERRGDRRRDPAVAAFGAPWHAAAAALDTAVSLPLLLVAAALPAGAVWLLAPPVQNGLEPPELTAAVATVVATLVALNRPVHRGSRQLLRRGALRLTSSPTAAVAVVAVLVVATLLLLSAAEGTAAHWWPLS